jgi:hypothetical protein
MRTSQSSFTCISEKRPKHVEKNSIPRDFFLGYAPGGKRLNQTSGGAMRSSLPLDNLKEEWIMGRRWGITSPVIYHRECLSAPPFSPHSSSFGGAKRSPKGPPTKGSYFRGRTGEELRSMVAVWRPPMIEDHFNCFWINSIAFLRASLSGRLHLHWPRCWAVKTGGFSILFLFWPSTSTSTVL